jgi:hypothetical protein
MKRVMKTLVHLGHVEIPRKDRGDEVEENTGRRKYPATRKRERSRGTRADVSQFEDVLRKGHVSFSCKKKERVKRPFYPLSFPDSGWFPV